MITTSYTYPEHTHSLTHGSSIHPIRLSFPWLDTEGKPAFKWAEGYTANLEWQSWQPYCSSGAKIADCKEEFLEGAYQHQTDIQEIFKFIITCSAILVVATPEGLPLAVMLALVYSSSEMSEPHTNCFVKELNSCGTIGNATAICSDKTGILYLFSGYAFIFYIITTMVALKWSHDRLRR